MGSVIHRRTVNIYEIPEHVFLRCIGRGLKVERDDDTYKIEVSIEEPLDFGRKNHIEIDLEPDPTQETHFIALNDSSLSMDAQKLTLTKQYTEYKITRNKKGMVLDVSEVEQWTSTDEVVLGVPYGYTANIAHRTGTANDPNFYQKS